MDEGREESGVTSRTRATCADACGRVWLWPGSAQVTTLLGKMKEHEGAPVVTAAEVEALKAQVAAQGEEVKTAKAVRRGPGGPRCRALVGDVRRQG